MPNSDSPLLGLSLRLPPSNLQAEQALLGALLANNRAYERVSEFLAPDHFADPVHGRIFQAIARRIEAGQLADAVMLKAEFEHAGVLDEVGGTAYLAQLLSAMVGIINAGEYGRAVHDAWLRRQLIDIGEVIVNNAFGAEPELDGSKQLEVAERALFDLASGEASGDDAPVSVAEAVRAAIEEGERAREGKGETCASTGLPSLDRRVLGLRPGHLLVAAGRPGMGKTALARTLALNVAGGRGTTSDGEILDDQRLGLPVAYFSLEETAADFGAACVAQLADVTVRDVLDGDLTVHQAARVVRAQQRVKEMPLMVFERPRQSLRQITMNARRAKRQHKRLGLVVVDYLQLMRDPEGAKDKRLAVGQNAYGLKDLAKELGCAVLVLSQLSRAVENRPDKRPVMADLRETGEIEDAADVILLLYRDEYYYRQTSPKVEDDDLPNAASIARRAWLAGLEKVTGTAEAIIPKVRRGEPGTVSLKFNGAHLRFEECSL